MASKTIEARAHTTKDGKLNLTVTLMSPMPMLMLS